MVSDKKRILDGSKYNRYFKPSKNRVQSIGKAGVMKTLDIMEEIVLSTLDQTKEIAQVLKGNDTYSTASNIWNFAHHYIQYKEDENGKEQLREPNRSWADRKTGIDCDCYSILISSMLTNLGIDHKFRITKYNGNDYYQHVYVVIDQKGKEIIIDPVISSFDYQKPYTGKHDKKMIRHERLSGINTGAKFGFEFDGILNGLGSVSDANLELATRSHIENTANILRKDFTIVPNGMRFLNQLESLLAVWNDRAQRNAMLNQLIANEGLSGLGGFFKNVGNAIKKVGSKVKTGVKKAVKAVVKYNPLTLAMRGGLLLAFKVNLFHFTEKLKYGYLTEAQAKANNLNMANYYKIKGIVSKVEAMFEKVGGDKANLKKGILNGKKGSLNDLRLTPEAVKTPTITKSSIQVAERQNVAQLRPQLQVSSFRPQAQAMELRLNGLGAEPVTTATTTVAASGLLATIGTWLKGVDWKNVFNKADEAKQAVQTVKTTVDQAKNIFNNGSGSSTVPTTTNPYGSNPQTNTPNYPSSNLPTTTLPTHNVVASQGMSKGTKTALLVGGGIAVAGIAFMMLKPKTKGLAGVPQVAI